MFKECFKRVQSSLAQYLSSGEGEAILNIEVINNTDLVDVCFNGVDQNVLCSDIFLVWEQCKV